MDNKEIREDITEGANYEVDNVEKHSVKMLKAEEFGGEYKRLNFFYLFLIFFISILAMITNSIKIFYRKFFIEKNKSLKRILWDMGRDKNHYSSIFIDRFSKINHTAKYEAANWKSLDLFYNYHLKIKPKLKNNLDGKITSFWMERIENRQAASNRLKIVINVLSELFSKFKNEPEIRLISIASGSAQAVVEVIKKHSKLNIKVVLLDLDISAIEKSKKIVKSEGLENNFSFICGRTTELEKICRNFKPHIIEMVGFLDYCTKEKAVNLITRIKLCLVKNGVFVTCNIKNNREKIFLDWVLLWPMIYKNEKEFIEILILGGFSPRNINIINEPFNIHQIAVCKK